MLILLFTLVVVGVTAYVWCIRGFFSALIHMVCVVAAGAIAFGVWEPVSYFLIGAAPERGFGSFLPDMAWGLGLALPFAISLAVLRGVIDKLLPANAQCNTAVDYIGGGVCGLVSGVISGGILVLSLGMLRLPADFGGYQSVAYTSGTGRGSVERTKDTFIPWVDRLTAGIYGHLSLTTLRTGEPLARWHPDMDSLPGAMRLSYESKSRTTLRPDAFRMESWYIVGDQQRPQPFDDLFVDRWSETPQKVSDLRGEMFGKQADDEALRSGYLAGFVVKFNTKAREKTGQVVIGNGQVRLVCVGLEDGDDAISLHPIAVVTRSEDPTKVAYARFRLDADGAFTSSVGGASDAVMAFEFPVPQGYQPLALYVKGIRHTIQEDLDDPPARPLTTFSDPGARDEAILAGAMAQMTDVGPIIDPSTGRPVEGAPAQTILATPITVNNALGFTIQKGGERGLEVTQESRGWSVVRGDEKFRTADLRGGGGIDFKLKIDRFSTSDDTQIVKVVLTPAQRDAEFNKRFEAADRAGEPSIVDKSGTRYPAAGWLYKDSSITWVRYDRQLPVQQVSELPAISRSSPDKELTLLFVVSVGVEVIEFRIGDAVMESCPPLKVEGSGRR